MSLVSAIRTIPAVGSRIGSYVGHARPNLTFLFQRQAPVLARMSFHKPMDLRFRSFSTSGTQVWKTLIKKDPSYLSFNHMKDLSYEKIQDLILLIEEEGVCVDEISLSVRNFNKELIQKLLLAVGKCQKTLPGFSVVNIGVYNQFKYFFTPDLGHLKECERLLDSMPYHFAFYQMQKIPLDDSHFVNELSEHLVKVGAKYPVNLILKDTRALAKPPLDPQTGKPDLSPLTKTISV